jgi:hypothetical protein
MAWPTACCASPSICWPGATSRWSSPPSHLPGSGPRAVFLGQHGGEQRARIFASLDVFVHSGCHETFAQTIQEAAAGGLPVVAPAVGGPVDLVGDGVTGYLVPPGGASTLASAVARLAADPAARAALGQAGRQRVAARSWAALGDMLLGPGRVAALAAGEVPFYEPGCGRCCARAWPGRWAVAEFAAWLAVSLRADGRPARSRDPRTRSRCPAGTRCRTCCGPPWGWRGSAPGRTGR